MRLYECRYSCSTQNKYSFSQNNSNTEEEVLIVAPPSESQIPDPAVTSSDPDNDRLSIIRRPSGIRFYLSYALARTYL